MGCFSFICKTCGKAILSNSFRGQEVELFALENGKVVEHMSGEYDSYGRVFIKGTQRKDVKHKLPESKEWEKPWHDICDLMFDDNNKSGIAAIHTSCWDQKTPTTMSESDPNQGWGEDFELLGDINPEKEFS